MERLISCEAFCKEVDRGDLLVGNNAEWAKEIAYRTPKATVPSCKRNNEENITVNLTERERVVIYCALGIQIKELEMKQIKLEKEIEKSSNPKDIEQYDHNEENLAEFRNLAQKFERKYFYD